MLGFALGDTVGLVLGETLGLELGANGLVDGLCEGCLVGLGPQSVQSVPSSHKLYELPDLPSSQAPSPDQEHKSLQPLGPQSLQSVPRVHKL